MSLTIFSSNVKLLKKNNINVSVIEGLGKKNTKNMNPIFLLNNTSIDMT